MPGLIIHYRQEFFEESRQVTGRQHAQAGKPRGLVGRQVANAEMLRAILRHGSDREIAFLIHNDADAASLKETLSKHLPGNKRAILKRFDRLPDWLPSLEETVLWQPQPSSSLFAWLRSRHQAKHLAISGITHALCSMQAIQTIKELIASPFGSVDRLVCTSGAVRHSAQALIDHAARQFGRCHDADRMVLETIPLGVDCDRHQPATARSRQAVRQKLQIEEDAHAILFVGRLSHHAKSNPLPMFVGCEQAHRRTGKKITLILCGWYADQAVAKAFQHEARRLAPGVSVRHVDGMDPNWRDDVWAAADSFISLADSVQETFGLTVVEAMSRRLPVIATDWDGYRETIRHNETGILIPTSMVSGAAERSWQALHEGHLSYDQFLASSGQTVSVNPEAVADAIAELTSSSQRCQAMGEQGYRHAHTTFDWQQIVARYEELWERQRVLVRRKRARAPSRNRASDAAKVASGNRSAMPATVVPEFQETFAKYPTRWLNLSTSVQIGLRAFGDLSQVASSPLANHASDWRAEDAQLSAVLQQCDSGQNTGSDLLTSIAPSNRQDSLAWLIKFDLLQPKDGEKTIDGSPHPIPSSQPCQLTLVTTCMGRLNHLQQSLPGMVAQENCRIVVVDYSCPDNAAQWIRNSPFANRVHVQHVAGREHYDSSDAKNHGWRSADTQWIAFVDADMLLANDFHAQVEERLRSGTVLRCVMATGAEGRGGLIVAQRDAIEAVGGYDLVLQGWAEDDEDLIDALIHSGQTLLDLPDEIATPLAHSDELRSENFADPMLHRRWLINRIYRLAKWDLARQRGEVPELEERKQMYSVIERHISELQHRTDVELRFGRQTAKASKLNVEIERAVNYVIKKTDG